MDQSQSKLAPQCLSRSCRTGPSPGAYGFGHTHICIAFSVANKTVPIILQMQIFSTKTNQSIYIGQYTVMALHCRSEVACRHILIFTAILSYDGVVQVVCMVTNKLSCSLQHNHTVYINMAATKLCCKPNSYITICYYFLNTDIKCSMIIFT